MHCVLPYIDAIDISALSTPLAFMTRRADAKGRKTMTTTTVLHFTLPEGRGGTVADMHTVTHISVSAEYQGVVCSKQCSVKCSCRQVHFGVFLKLM